MQTEKSKAATERANLNAKIKELTGEVKQARAAHVEALHECVRLAKENGRLKERFGVSEGEDA